MALSRNWLAKMLANVGNRAVSALLQFITIGLLITNLTPAEFGLLNLIFWGARLAQPAFGLGLGPIAQRDIASLADDGPGWHRSVVALRLMKIQLSIVAVFLTLCLGGWFLAPLVFDEPKHLLALFAFFFAIQTTAFCVEEFGLRALQAMNHIPSSLMSGGFLRTVVVCTTLAVAFALGVNFTKVVLIYAAALTFTTACVLFLIGRAILLNWKGQTAGDPELPGQESLGQIGYYGGKIALVRFIAQMRYSAEGFIVFALFGLEVSGIVGGYRRIAGGLLSIVESLNLMTGSFVSNLIKTNTMRLQRILYAIPILGASFILSVICTLQILRSYNMLDFVGADFVDNLHYLTIMLVPMLIQVTFGNARIALMVTGHASVILWMQLFYAVLFWVLTFITAQIGTVIAVILALGICSVIETAHFAWMGKRRIGVRFDLYSLGIFRALLPKWAKI